LREISLFALQKIVQQYRLYQDGNLNECSHHFTKIYGLPCCYAISNLLRDNEAATLLLGEIHPYWFFSRPDGTTTRALELLPPPPAPTPLLYPPYKVVTKGRLKKVKGPVSSTRRDPSQWEQGVHGGLDTVSRQVTPESEIWQVKLKIKLAARKALEQQERDEEEE
jgi:hypothetical protein